MLPVRVGNDVLSKLQFSKDYVNIDIGNNRPNVSIIIHGIHHPLNTYVDLDFIVAGIKSRADLKKTWIYADNIATSVEIIDHLTGLLTPELQDAEYRKKAMEKFKEGTVRILVCTDAAGMGSNIPDIDVVVQWKLPLSVSVFVQRAGRAAQAYGQTGIAILFVEPSAYVIDLFAELAKEQGAKGKKKGPSKEKESEAEKRKKAQERKVYTESRGIDCGAAGGKHDAILVADTPQLNLKAANEGLLPSAIKCGEVNKDLQVALDKWRTTIKERDYMLLPLFSASAILQDETIALLSSVGPINSKEHLQKVLAGQWTWWPKYGMELYECLAAQEIPAMVPLPPKTKGKKHVAAEMASGLEVESIVSTLARFLHIVLRVISTPRVVYLSGYHTLFDLFRVPPRIPTYDIRPPREDTVRLVLLLREHTSY
ncbi:hypothetical protein B0H14DRAFT_3425558 [Mycena olivaceomarginata]|nr:hypothetical protein B0H14DRAFT_3425558 [Mycena olivaceomarginata]